MKPEEKIPLKRYRLLTTLLNQDKEIYTNYKSGRMPVKIEFPDLVSTLKINPDFYHRPIVELEDYGYMVRGNNIFFEAGVQAGLKSFICDINIRTLEDKHMSQFQLMDVIPEVSPYSVEKIFFIDNNYTLPTSDLKTFNNDINERLRKAGIESRAFFEVVKSDTIIFKAERCDENPQIAYDLAKELLTIYGTIRSINGLVRLLQS